MPDQNAYLDELLDLKKPPKPQFTTTPQDVRDISPAEPSQQQGPSTQDQNTFLDSLLAGTPLTMFDRQKAEGLYDRPKPEGPKPSPFFGVEPTREMMTKLTKAKKEPLDLSYLAKMGSRTAKNIINSGLIEPVQELYIGSSPGEFSTAMKMVDSEEFDKFLSEPVKKNKAGEAILDISEITKRLNKIAKKEQQKTAALIPTLGVAKPGTKSEKALDFASRTAGGIGGFLLRLWAMKKLVGGTPSIARDTLAWELESQSMGGTPGKGAIMKTALGGIEKIPTVSALGKAGKVAAGGGMYGGITLAQGGSVEEVVTNTLIGAGFQAWGIHKQNQFLKRLETQLKKSAYNEVQGNIQKGHNAVKAEYQKNLQRMDTKDATDIHKRALKAVTQHHSGQLERQEGQIAKVMDLMKRKVHHGTITEKLKMTPEELAKEIAAKGVTPRAAREAAKIDKPTVKRQELAKKGYPEEIRPDKVAVVPTTRAARKAGTKATAPQRQVIVHSAEGREIGVYPEGTKFSKLPAGAKISVEPMHTEVVPQPQPQAPLQELPVKGKATKKEEIVHPEPTSGVSPEKRDQAIKYVQEVLNDKKYDKLDEKDRTQLGVDMLEKFGVEITPEELSKQPPATAAEVEAPEKLEPQEKTPVTKHTPQEITIATAGETALSKKAIKKYPFIEDEPTNKWELEAEAIPTKETLDRWKNRISEGLTVLRNKAGSLLLAEPKFIPSEYSEPEFKPDVPDLGKKETYISEARPKPLADASKNRRREILQARIKRGESVGPKVLAEFESEDWVKDIQVPTEKISPTDAPESKLITSVVSHMETGEALPAKQFFQLADEAYGGTRAEGKYGVSDAYDVLEVAVNKYMRLSEEREQPKNLKDAQNDIAGLEKLLDKLPSQTNRGGEKDQYQQFSTPPHYAYALSWIANIGKEDIVLEPEAGTGSLLVHAINAKPAKVYANELSKRRAKLLEQLGVDKVFTEDAEQLHNILPEEVRPSVVIMNPPFSRAPERMGDKKVIGTDLKHIQASLNFLQEGGRLVAIMGRKMREEQGENKNFQEWIDRIKKVYDVRANVYVDRKIYRKYGTQFPTRVLVIDKTGPSQGEIVGGTVDSIGDLLYTMQGVRNERTEAKRESVGETLPATAEKTAAGSELPVQPAISEAPTGELRPARSLESTTGEPGRTGGPAVRGGLEPGKGTEVPTRRPEITESKEEGVSGGRDVSAREPVREPAVQHAETVDTITVGTEKHKRLPKKESTDLVFEEYLPRKFYLPNSKEHPASLVESKAMAAVDPPDIHYELAIPEKVVKKGQLSTVQLEAVAYAGQAHEQFLPENTDGVTYRKGYFIGDGTGLGKGREIAGIFLDNWNHGRKKALWISETKDLINAAHRDWEAVGGKGKVVFAIPGSYEDVKTKNGIMFATYATLRGKSKDEQPKRRLDQILNWLGEDFDGVIVFDESHNMANVTREKGARGWTEPSQRALAGLELQDKLPKARIVYSSATGATEVRNLLYASRLGLWGSETPFVTGSEFIAEMTSGGIANMELVARDMKALGLYASRSISFNDGTEKGTVKYERLEHKLTPEQEEVYNKLAEGWQITLQNMEAALAATGGDRDKNAKGAAKSAYWGANQRFFNQIITAMQTPSVVNKITEDMKTKNSVVIQLTNTQEAAQTRALAKLSPGQSLEDFDVTPRDILMQLVEHSFPVTQYETYVDENDNTVSRAVTDSQGNPIQNREAVKMREDLLDQLGSIKVPDSPLDMIINHFGMDNVAEVTGRSRRVIKKLQDDGTKKRVIDKRNKASNRADINAFMNGKKRILIFSEAGGTGVSYHADNDAKNQQHRVHYLLQPGWRADKAMQGLGRTHRSNQASAPTYVLVTTNLKGQKRFISSIARRLAQLGALTKGERKAGESGMFSAADNLESHEAKDALLVFWRDLYNGDIENINIAEFEKQTGLVLADKQGNLKQNLPPIRQFLNRLLSLNVDMQNKVFDAYEQRLISKVEQAIVNGTLDQGMESYKADKIEKLEEMVVYTHPQSNTETKYVKLKISKKNKPISWDAITRPQGYNADKFVQSNKGKIYAVFHAHAQTDATTGRIVDRYRLMPPHGHSHFEDQNKIDWGHNWTKFDKDKAKPVWEEQFGKIPKYHEAEEHFLTGLILPIWDKIRGTSRIYHILTDEGEDMIGRTLHPNQVTNTLKALGTALDESITTEQAFNRILQGDIEVELDNQWKIRYARVQGEDRLELVGSSFAHDAELTAMGVFKERIQYETRYFIPTATITHFGSLVRRHKIVDITYLSTDDPTTDIPAYGIGGFVRIRGEKKPSVKVSAIIKEDMSTGSKNADAFLKRTKGFTSSGGPGILKRVAGWTRETFFSFHYLEWLPKQPEYADIREHFRHTEEIARLAMDAATNKMKWALKPLEGIKQELQKRFQAVEMKIIADDLQEDVDKGLDLPPGITAADIKIMRERAQELYDKYPSVRDSYDRVRQICQEVGDMLVQEGMLNREDARDFYFPHRVIKYLRKEDSFFGIPTRKPAQYKPKYLKKRKGGHDYSTDIMERLVEHWAAVQRDVAYRQFLEKVLKEEQQNYFKVEYPEWREFTKDETGKRHRNLVPEGYKEVTVLPGRYYYSTYGITEDMAKAIINQNLESIEEMFDTNVATQIRKVLALGKKRSYIVREPIARQIHDMPTMPISRNSAYLAVKGFNTFVKGQILFNPLYTIPFHVQNFIGDASKVMVALPSSLQGKYLVHYWKEIIAAHGGEKSERFEQAQRYGVIGSGWIGTDIPELKAIMPEIEKAEISGAAKHAANKIKRLWNLAQKVGAGREDWLRYALFDRLMDLEEQGKDVSKYAIKDSHTIAEITDPAARAAKVARDIAGDYKAIGKTGRMISDLFVPFYRWMHLNLPWWPRMVKEYAKKGQYGRLIQALLAAATPYIISMIWNYSDDERRKFEQSLPPWKRWNFHINSLHGKKMYYVQLPLDDVLNFIGVPEDILDIQRYQRGKINGPELVKRIVINSTYEPGMSVLNAVGGLTAVIRDVIGWQTFPDFKDYREKDWARKGLNITSDIFGAPGQLGKQLYREGIRTDPLTGDIVLGTKTKDTLNRAWMGIRPYSVDLDQTKEYRSNKVYKSTNRRQGRVRGKAHKGKQRLVDSLDIQLEEQ